MNTNIVASLVSLAKTRGDDIAYQYFFEDEQPSKPLTYAQLDQNAREIASQLKVHFKKGDRALLLYNSGFEFVEAFFACLYAGVVAVPAYPPKKNQNIDRLRSIIVDAGAAGALTTARINDIARPLFESEPSLTALPIYTTDERGGNLLEPLSWQDIDVESSDLAFLQYTSGSTGNPKGVMVDHANIIDNEEMMKQAFGHDQSTAIVSWLPHFHDMGLIFGIMHPIYIGAPAALMNPTYFLQKPLRWLKLLSETKALTSSAPNFAYDLCVDTVKDDELEALDLSNWRCALNGAEPVRASTLERFYQKFKRCGLTRQSISPCYGMAETTLFATGGRLSQLTKVLKLNAEQMHQGKAVLAAQYQQEQPFYDFDALDNEQSYHAISCGVSWQNHTIAIVNPNSKQRCDEGTIGEIWVKGASVAKGYWQNEQATEETFNAYIAKEHDGPYLRTGDLGFIYQEELYVTGRCKDVLIFRGKNYYPQDIELTVTEAHDALDNNGGAAFSVPTENGDEGLVVVQQVKRTALRKLNAEQVFLRVTQAIIEQHGITPYELVLIKPGRILKTSSGKIQRQENKRHYLSNCFEPVARSRDNQHKQSNTSSVKPTGSSFDKTMRDAVQKILKEVIAFEVDKDAKALDVDATFQSLGIDSMKAVRISGELMEIHNIELEATVLYEHPSIAQLTDYLCEFESVQQAFKNTTGRVKSDNIESVKDTGDGVSAPQPRQQLKQVAANHQDNDIAVIGMACRYPQAEDIGAYWQLLVNKVDAISTPSVQRLSLCQQLNENRMGGYLDDIDCFDPAMFSLSATEAKFIDPQHRILLETTYHTIEAAGYRPEELAGESVGVYVGISQNDYFLLSQQLQSENPYLGTGTALSIAANRLSYTYNFTGPSVVVDTACSSSLVALHQAMQAIRTKEVPLALVSGVNLILSNEVTDACASAQMLSADGHCKTFSQSANGYVRSEGVGSILLKPLAQALADNDPIYGVLKGSAVNQDGRSNGLTAPNGGAQQKVINAALANAGVPGQDIQYVETHGTGTELGDPIEVSALNKTYGAQKTTSQPLLLGSTKANIGHLESGAGIAGLIKALLCLQHKQLPGQRYVEQLNPHIAWDKMPLTVKSELTDWPDIQGKTAMAGVSSFGFGGTNAHVICSEAPLERSVKLELFATNTPYILPLSAKSEASLLKLIDQYAQRISLLSDEQFDALVHTVAHRPFIKGFRGAVHATSRSQLLENLKKGNHQTFKEPATKPEQVFLFTGQGAQYYAMGKALYDTQPVFKEAIEQCDALLADKLEPRLLDVLYADEACELLHQTKWTQVTIFAIEYALCKLWVSLGMIPDKLIGHSVGEYAAACIAGVFSLKDAIKLIAARAVLMEQLEATGTMVSARCAESLAQELIEPFTAEAAISAYHGESGVVFSGGDEAIKHICEQLTQRTIKYKALNTARAFHSPLMQPMLAEFKAVAETIEYGLPCYEFISSVSGQPEQEALCQPDYWVDQITKPVRFAQTLTHLASLDYFCVVEMGPKPVLSTIVQENLPRANCEFIAVLHPKGDGFERYAAAIARAFELGIEVNWPAIYPSSDIQRQPLPNYPFAKSRFWVVGDASNLDSIETDVQPQGSDQSRHEAISGFVLNTLSSLLSIAASDIEVRQPLLEMGVDSLMIMQAVRTYEKEFALEFSVRQFYEELSTVERLVDYIERHSNYQTAPVTLPSPTDITEQPKHSAIVSSNNAVHAVNEQVLTAICKEQLQAAASVTTEQARLSVDAVSARQLQMLQGLVVKQQPSSAVQSANLSVVQSRVSRIASTELAQKASVLPGFQSKQLSTQQGNEQSKRYQAQLAKSYCDKTLSSKELVAENRAHLADCRASAGFRLSSKEMLYPVFAKRCEGARIWDIDDNEYIDITMDFGVNLFGHKPEFITQALYEQIDSGLQLGLASPLACDVAQLITELTGLERVTFCNSGTEAVMTAVRLARTHSKRDKIVQFNGAYHGHYDGTLAHPTPTGDDVEPMCSGVRHGAIADNLVLDYGCDQALETIRAQADSIAAVLVEPVQSRHPELQPWEFLHQLRALTKELGIALIFDEMITGFRAHPGGVQALLGIQADMATYGKIVGGGMPIGVVAGSAQYLDCIDGGVWQYGDQSYPQVDTTFFAGTFCKHPLAMASAKAVLKEIKKRGEQCQEQISAKTTYLKQTLNAFFESHKIPISVESFASLFRFRFNQNLDVFFYEMLNRGVFIWEGRNCFLSDAHSDADVEAIIQAVIDSVLALQQAGYFGPVVADIATQVEQFALTQAQQQLLALALRSEEGAKAYHLQATVKLQGALDKERLQDAVEKVCRSIPMLNYGLNTDKLCHQKLLDVVLPLEVIELESGDTIQNQLQILRYRPFNYELNSLCRFVLIVIDEDTHYLSIVAHHVLFDGIAMAQLLESVAQFYCQRSTETAQQFVHFCDYVNALDSYRASPRFTVDEQYWLNQLAGCASVSLPKSATSNKAVSYEVDSLKYEIDSNAISNLTTLAQQQGCGQFATLLAIYMLWLHKLSRETVIAVAIPVSDRQLLAQSYDSAVLDQGLVGYCTNILPITVNVGACQDVAMLVKAVQTQLLDAFEHQHYPYSALTQQEVNLPATLFNLDKVQSLPDFAGLTTEDTNSSAQYGQFEFSCNLVCIEQQWSLQVEFNKGKFGRDMVEHHVQSLMLLLGELQSSDALSSRACSLLGKQQYHSVLLAPLQKGQHEQPINATVVSDFDEAVKRYPEHIALQSEQLSLSYQELDERVSQMARYLADKGVCEGQLIAIALPRRNELLITLLAVMRLGAAYLPLDLAYPESRIKDILDDANVAMLICDSQSEDSGIALQSGYTIVDIDNDQQEIAAQSSTTCSVEITSEHSAYVIYTSGSTGRPKGVEISHGGLGNFLRAMQVEPGISVDDKLLAITTIAFDIAMLELFLPLTVGATTVIANEQVCSDPHAIAALIKSADISIMQATPTLWRLLLNTQPSCVNGLKVLCGGEPLDQVLASQVLVNGGELWNMYGPTETTIWSALSHITDEQQISIGDGIANTSLLVMDEQAQSLALPLPVGVWGELWIGGAGVAKGYLNREALTDERFVNHEFTSQLQQRVYKTGDRARRLADGRIELQGRLDQQVKLNGHRIELGEIEYHISQIVGCSYVKVLIISQSNGHNALCAYCLDFEQRYSHWTLPMLRQQLAQYLPSYMLPDHLCWLEHWPTTANGKLDTKALPDLKPQQPRDCEMRLPQTPSEETLLQCYLLILQCEKFSTTQSFFDGGGNSVLAMQLVSSINTAFGVRITVADVFDYPSVFQLAQRIDDLFTAKAACAAPDVKQVSNVVSGRDISGVLADQSMTEMDL
ncbi:hybrid non-ribosomal peptide synthetase/type I polyketide synthase [Pseudoalteromonas byunsanensis]|uniref:Non-ribosomal peptide synthetase n=1 Tax=Pseudoalteromonas byunsanensis TaxID=327939 RepID=A0A1S1NAS8_9GAMM|nr:hybrid non-ribosomal peptide synthetase/type I polyketide synthase [Pseudoalteromonas byunsanensis]OHU96486.1 non-ribosomal peptide synthetase [Pseudoalteromonas byunsanensis]